MPKNPPESAVRALVAAARPSMPSLLNAATDHLNEQIQELEALLISLDLGVSHSFDVDAGEDGAFTLVFGKLDDQWQLYVDFGDATDCPPPKRLVHCTRAIRVHAARRLENLATTLVQKSTDELERVSESAQEVGRAIAAVNEMIGRVAK